MPTANQMIRIFLPLLVALSVTVNAEAALTDISNSPLITGASTPVQPNLFLMMDDSGSMAWDYMPDNNNSPFFGTGTYGYASSQCNGVFYDPAFTYAPPVGSTGASYPNSSFTAAPVDGFGASTTATIDLSAHFALRQFTNSSPTTSGGAAAYYYKYSGAQNTEVLRNFYNSGSTFYKECNSSIGATPGSSVFTKVTVSATSGPGGTDERTNFANWYSYYRTRLLMMKSSAGLAFNPIGTSYRVGFATMNNNRGSDFINLATFDASQKAAWYAKLYGVSAGNSTPLLGALSKVGLMYAYKLPGNSLNNVAANDPMQYSCQQNYAILSTDGFWNSESGNSNLQGQYVGEQDGVDIRPMYDGIQADTTVTTTYTRNSYSTVTGSCSSGKKQMKTQPQTGTCSITTVNGVAGSETCSWSNSGSAAISGTCANPYTLPSPNPSARVQSGTPVTTTGTVGGSSNTLADVAEYYYLTDLRTSTLGNNLSSATGFVGTDVSTNNVPSGGQDAASWQHMTTFTLGLGARGRMVFSPTYQTDTSGDFFSVKNGMLANSAGGVCSWQSSGSICNWPIPNVSGTPENIDDLWHAAVDGRGTYFSATNPSMLALGLSTAFANVSARTGGSAAATTSNPNVTSGDNFVFSSSFATVNWTGQLIRQQLDLTTGAVLSSIDWCADDVSVSAGGAPKACPAPNNLLDNLAAATPAGASRNIYFYSAGATNGLLPFTYANLSTAQQAFFNQPAIASMSQLCTGSLTCLPVWQAATVYNVGNEYRVGTTWYQVKIAYTSGTVFGATDMANAVVETGAAGANLVNFLRGDRSNEGILTDSSKYFRQRPLILGDIVNAEAVYMKTPLHTYADPGFMTYAAGLAARQGMVYAAANDGMLHAFYASTGAMDANGNAVASGGVSVTGGAEAWAYIPSMVLSNLYHLADKSYSNNHQYYVDGTPIAADICTRNCTDAATAVWRTILVGGLNAGGRGYYAMDITNPAQPKALWEFTDTNMGLTYGNPEIAKVCDDSTCATKTWAVLVTSGYNNVSTGDGIGRLYVINAATGALIRTISTGVGNTSSPSGLSKIIAQTISPGSDETILEVYGGDLLGNMWRFDVNNNVGAAGYDAQLLVTLQDSGGNIQPVTEKPQVGISNGNTLVFVGTGRYLGTSDLPTTSMQTIYGIKDPLTSSTTPGVAIYPINPHSIGSGFIGQVQTTTTCPANSPVTICLPGETVRTSTSNVVNLATDSGWYVDLPDSGERSYTDPTLQLGTLGFTTNVPSVSSCTVGGYSYSYFFDYRSGAPVSTSVTHVLGIKLGNALATRPVYVMLPNNTVVQLIRMSDGSTMTSNVPIGSGSTGTRRISRRELITQ
ncbi:neisseria PilC protein [mine drainage metagenome]|uniref:Neisseria PilC protein n=1 Tax=mine drainage metagenome TaxID=410659 RepID=A0A1J5QSM8_9ZZZZ